MADLGQEATSSQDFSHRIRSVLHVIMGTFLTNRGAILSYQRHDRSLAPIAVKGLDDLPASLPASLDEMWRRRNEPAGPAPAAAPEALADLGIAVYSPLWARDHFMGTLALGPKFTGDPYTAEDAELLRAIAHQLAISLHNHALFLDLSEKLSENRRLYEEMRLIYHDTIQAFAAAIDAKDPYTRNHSYRVARYVVAIAKQLGWDEADVEGIYIAGLLHDVGKIVLSDAILKKETPLTREEIDQIKRHPNLSYDILSKVKFPWKDIVYYIRHHHERLDGSGYPDHLDRSSLSDGAKILTLADAFDAMTTDRPYRQGMGLPAALEELKRCLSTQFDSRILHAFVDVLDKEVRGELPEPDILPHLDPDFDASVITMMLETIRDDLRDDQPADPDVDAPPEA